MPTRSSKAHDFNVVAYSIVQTAIGEQPPDAAVKNPAAVALGRLGGKKGGTARGAALSPERRKFIAQQAAAARWSVDNKDDDC